MTAGGAKRFYRSVSVRDEEGGFAVVLDSRPVRTPAGNPLVLPERTLAQAVAREWDEQTDRIRAGRMPLTRLVNTALEQTAPRPEPVIERLAAFGETDLLCHRADFPDELVSRQQAEWQPMLDWAADALGVRLTPVAGIRALPQASESLHNLRRHLQALDPLNLTAAETAASVTGSVVLSLALAYGRLDAESAWRISRVDEDYQIEKWGEDAEALRQAGERRKVLDAAAAVFAALRPEPASPGS
ncbi:MAG: ATP12 family chaperone protein [Alphaproteobacteria bacterium]